ASGTTITVVNDCGFTVWPGILGRPVLSVSGFELEKGARQSFEVLGNWSGTIWGRTGCTFNGSGHGSCATGDCGGEMECNGRNYTQPVTILEIDVNTGYDLYNVSLMKGFNLPMTIEPSRGDSCLKMGCVNDLNQRCPPELQLEGGGGCNSACHFYGSPDYCCLNSYETAPCSVSKYGRLFESACPQTVTYETNDLGIYRCWDADYTVRFCPPSDTFSTIKLDRLLMSV
nr:G-type lectin S-receptor-like serine/threonine-protein kinase At1g67520 [Tanacetum cinerariifolium]